MIALLALLCSMAHAENWPQWRGPANNGVSKETNLPAEWSDNQHIVWKLDMPGAAGSTPIVWGDRIFLTSEDGDDLVLLCLSTAGKEIWKRKVSEGKRQYMRDEANNASPSPSTDGKHVWTYFGTGDLACYDFEGKEVWKFNVQDRYGKFKIQWGMHTTPLLDGDRLYMQLIHSGGAWVLALDKATGREIWKVPRKSDGRGENEQSYASPSIYRKGKVEYLVTHGQDYAIAYSLDDGKEIWRVGDLNPNNAQHRYRMDLRFVASPLVTPEVIVIPSAKQHDIVGVSPEATGFVGTGNKYELWRRAKGTPDVPSPLAYDGLLYLCGEGGVLTCLDLKTGKEHYQQRLHGARYRGSPVYADGKVYLTARDGVITVVKAGPTFEQLAVNKMPDQIAASPAIANGRIYIRGFKTLYAIGK
jgi:outer membrane protein assembly factor BamB